MPSIAQPFFRALNSIVLPLVRAGLGSPLPVGFGVVVLESTGRRSRQVRSVPLVAARIGDRVMVSTFRDNSQWVRNLEADSKAAVWLCGTRREVSATSIDRGNLTTVALRPTPAA